MNFKELQKVKIEQIEHILKESLPKVQGEQNIIVEAMEYSLLAGGKRIRPMLMQETYRMFQGEQEELLHLFMAAMEMIHTYSLVHDDLPAMDDDEYRRGRKTTHIVYGEDMGILAGDALLNYAFETAASAFEKFPQESLKIGKAIQILGKKAGIFGMIGGQVVDVQSTGKQISGETLEFIYRLKTGALIEASMMIGAVLAGAGTEEISGMEKIAQKIGMAFQIQDDILDVTSTTQVLGKPVKSDEKNEKMTYVVWKGLDKAKEEVEELSREAIKELRKYHPKDTYLEELLESLIYREK
ncbi:MAG: polyprenyl synthetase family protein [Candidatus Ruminococcus intestinipullorum]|nr:polyprenyl synthetase family protein [Candidatus Ruminococcus intestinipullorum]